ncbi:MAG TPA: DUF4388 domain-containing protein, partial [Thermomicrobiales bacterium]|nr:DUF4388 domain-containing protein [Thermomicrobiales bacterium]
MALAGDIEDYPLAELLFFLSSKQRTGELVLEQAEITIVFALRHGRLIAAQMIPTDQRLGERLVSGGVITPSMLSDALQRQEQTPERQLGAILVERGDAPRETVIDAIRGQITDCLVAFLIAPGGTFLFQEKPLDTDMIDVDVIVEREVLDALRRADEYVTRQIDT